MTKIHEHGYIRLVESWGHGDARLDNECGIVEAARQSTQGSFRGWENQKCPECGGTKVGLGAGPDRENPSCGYCNGKGFLPGDTKLLKHLYDNKHSTPFEFAGCVIEVQAPIFVFREWHRHRNGSYNEMSARYAPLPNLNYVPTVERLLRSSATNKQAGVVKGADDLDIPGAECFRAELEVMYAAQEAFYQHWLTRGVPKELARIDLPVGRYSRMRASANLRNWLAFMTLRSDPAAQEEIRVYSRALADILRHEFPQTMRIFDAK